MTKTIEAKPSAQILQFPARTKDGFTFDPETVQENIIDMKIAAVEDTLDFLVPHIFESLMVAGYKCEDDFMGEMLVAHLRAIMHQHFKLQNPLLDFYAKHEEKLEVVLADQLTTLDLGNGEAD